MLRIYLLGENGLRRATSLPDGYSRPSISSFPHAARNPELGGAAAGTAGPTREHVCPGPAEPAQPAKSSGVPRGLRAAPRPDTSRPASATLRPRPTRDQGRGLRKGPTQHRVTINEPAHERASGRDPPVRPLMPIFITHNGSMCCGRRNPRLGRCTLSSK